MRSLALAVALVAGLAPAAVADEWKAATRLEAWSPSHQLQAVVEPSVGSQPAVLTVTDRSGAQPAQRYQRAPVNDASPVELYVSDDGRVVTTNEWASNGYAHSLVIYDPSGAVVIDRRLEELLLPAELATKVSQSVSSRWWLDDGKTRFTKDTIELATSWGAVLGFRLADGAELRAGQVVAIPSDAVRFGEYATGARAATAATLALEVVFKDAARVWGWKCAIDRKGSACETWGDTGHRALARRFKAGALATWLAAAGALPLSHAPGASLPGAHVLVELTFSDGGADYDYKVLVPARQAARGPLAALRTLAGVARRLPAR